jgi:phosphoribosylanthranilate isomerase
MIVQIYEITYPEEAVRLGELGVDHMGVLAGRGAYPRELGYSRVREIFEVLPEGTKSVCLSLSGNVPDILEAAEATRPDILHLGTLPETLSPQDMRGIRSRCPEVALMRSVPVDGEDALHTAMRFAEVSDYLLLDTAEPHDTQIGATGSTHDWTISRRIVRTVPVPVLLAGGLGPENVERAIRTVRPAGVDSKTRTDLPGTHRKDPERVRELVRIAKSLD